MVATRDHYIDHLEPVWTELRRRGAAGTAYLTADTVGRLPGAVVQGVAVPVNPTLVASFRDIGRCGKAPIIRMQHGSGQMYEGIPIPEGIDLWLTNGSEDTDGLVHRGIPGRRIIPVGSPYLDRWTGYRRTLGEVPNVVFACHWDQNGVPEQRGAFLHYIDAIADLKATSLHPIGHAHPRFMEVARVRYEDAGIPILETFDDVMHYGDVLVADNTSALYLFAATDRPVVVLDAPWYRRGASHGLRVWSCSDVGIRVTEKHLVREAIWRALQDPEEVARKRRAIIDRVYTNLGTATAAAADAITSRYA